MIIAVLFIYILISLFIVIGIYKYFHTKKSIAITIIIMLLIPTWDIVLGYPIYKFLCWKNAGVHIYKTVDNVEGFYVGKRSKRYEPYEPYKGYKFVDYKEKENGKYYRSYWVDNNTSKDCIPYGIYKFSDYAKAFRHGKCIVKKEIPEKEVSQWEYNLRNTKSDLFIPVVNIYKITAPIIDRKNHKNIAKSVSYLLDNNWFLGFAQSMISSKGKWASCGGIKGMLKETLKPKKGEK
jgi:hypothetical protein